ncbi:flagellar biosynthesis protein FlgI [Campylobacter pinnipediorum subsp. pinnipediorum]|uniref:Flagellar P-ring protein n=1 Tax=Campylobacter pinnipediorum subsp. pinnipediorum TaxID=1660067 RepID=A0AAX0LBZ3_9BACT|nr:flagellar basal body P-ring protein FlgI [Campylobacter pinnipediorum]OPA79529.1 flagellar biosynthesis protein FlgI [Campylobacter pinnipediorum subsp. pinnipediorum]OPA81865.1 flagellar biosynthesis protein FlgI [Campylobacter pinnipediorum subsp. pinnipediorum]
MKKFVFLVLILATLKSVFATQIKDIASVLGVRENQLIGYGLVVGLNGTGDGSTSEFTIQSLSNMLQTVNVKINPDDIKSKNTAAVIVTATLPPFARQGDQLDVTISSIGDAKSLQGGTLLMTPLKGVDGDIYALAQGSLSIGGKIIGRGGDKHMTAGLILNGALVEKEVAYDIYNQQSFTLSLKTSNFKVAMDTQNTINSALGIQTASAIDPKTIIIKKPDEANLIDIISTVLNLDIDYTTDDKVVIDERSGTIVSGINVSVDPVILTHGDITIKIEPNSYNKKSETDFDLQDGSAISPKANLLRIEDQKTTLATVTRALNKLGASPSDIIAIIQNLKRVGAIHVDVKVM